MINTDPITDKEAKTSSFLSFLNSPNLNTRELQKNKNGLTKVTATNPVPGARLVKKGSVNFSVSTNVASPLPNAMSPLAFEFKDGKVVANPQLKVYTQPSSQGSTLESKNAKFVGEKPGDLPTIKDDEREYMQSELTASENLGAFQTGFKHNTSGEKPAGAKRLQESFSGSATEESCSCFEENMGVGLEFAGKQLEEEEEEEEEFGLKEEMCSDSESSCSMDEEECQDVMPSPNFKPMAMKPEENFCSSMKKIMKEREELRRKMLEEAKTQYGDAKDREKIEDTEFVRFKAPQERDLKPGSMCLKNLKGLSPKKAGKTRVSKPRQQVATASEIAGAKKEVSLQAGKKKECYVCKKAVKNHQIVTFFDVCEHKFHENCLLELVTFPNSHNYQNEVLFCPLCTVPRDNQHELAINKNNNLSSLLD
jgi:hypothetical protein